MALSRALSNFQRHISSTATATTTFHRNKSNFSVLDLKQMEEKYEYHGLLTKGFKGPLVFYHNHNAFVFRLDLPGIRSSDLRCTANASNFSFTAQEPKPHRFGFGHCEPRYYEANIEVDPLFYQAERFTANVTNGVLLVEIPKIRVGTPGMGRICLNVGRLKTHMDPQGNITVTCVEQPATPYLWISSSS